LQLVGLVADHLPELCFCLGKRLFDLGNDGVRCGDSLDRLIDVTARHFTAIVQFEHQARNALKTFAALIGDTQHLGVPFDIDIGFDGLKPQRFRPLHDPQ